MTPDPPRPLTDRAGAARLFLARCGWQDATFRHLAGDASDRSYARLRRGDASAVLMDAPPGTGDNPADFLRIAAHLASIGLSPPRVLGQDLAAGFLLLEDLGDGLFARLADDDPAREAPLYAAATDVLVHLQAHPAPPGLHDLSAADWAEAAALALDVYASTATGTAPLREAFVEALTGALQRHADGPRVLILRDYHAENLLWLPERQGVAAVGLLDFQLGQLGQPAYDLVSLLQDARRDLAAHTAPAMIRRFQEMTGAADIGAACAVLGAQRALRILGIFARLCVVAGKPGYLPMMPRVWAHLQTNLAHPALAELAAICETVMPAPTPAILERIARQCATPPPR